MNFFLRLIEEERLVALMSRKRKVADHMINNHEEFREVLNSVVMANQNKVLVRQISKKLNISATTMPPKSKATCAVNKNHKRFVIKRHSSVYNYESILNGFNTRNWYTTQKRVAVYDEMRRRIPNKPSISEAIKTLEYVSTIISKSHRSSLSPQRGKYRDLLPFINHCFKVIHDNGETDLRDIQAKYVKIGKAIDFGMEHRSGFFFEFLLKI